METSWLKLAGVLSAAGIAALIWMQRSPEKTEAPDAVPWQEVAGRPNVVRPAPLVSDAAPHSALAIRGHVDTEAKARPRSAVRQLNTQRPADLENDPQFQRLLEIDSARKMALVQGDPEDLTHVRQQLAGAKISRRVLEQALLDPSAEVRLAALYEISLEMDEPPLDLLAPVVESDPDPEVRLEALGIVADIETRDADAVISRVLDDPDESIRTEAQDLMESRFEDPL